MIGSNEIVYLEEIHVSELLFQIPTRSFDIGGGWRRETEILENTSSGEIGRELDGKNKQKF